MTKINKNIKLLIAYWLDEASERLSYRSCNDVDESVWKDWTLEERREFVKGYYAWNGNPEDYDPDNLHLMDWMLTGYLSELLKENCEETLKKS